MATLLVVYRDGQNHISGGARSYRKWGHRKSRDRKRSWLEVTASGLDPEVTKWSRAHVRKWIPTLFSYYSSTKCSTVVQIPGLPEVTKGQVTPKEVPLVWFHACGTGSCPIFTLLGSFHRKWRHQTSRDPEGITLEGWVASMRNRKLRSIRSNVTRRVPLENMGARMRDWKYPWGDL